MNMYWILKEITLLNNYISNSYTSQIAYIDNNSYKLHDNRAFTNTDNTSQTINQYTTDVDNNYKTNNVANKTHAYYIMFIDDVVTNKHNTVYTNDNINVTQINQLVIS